MSEYQFYEFRSIDKPLTKEEQNEINRWSSRTRANTSGAIFTYSYSDFPHDEEKVVEHYFDSMFYVANWGSKRLIFKFPKELINIEEIEKYCNGEEISLKVKKNNILLDFDFSQEDSEDWIDGEGYLTSLISLRDDIINGDYRCLYLAWLHINVNINQKNTLEPDVPAGLSKLNSALKAFVDLLNIDEDIISAAVKNSKTNEFVKPLEYSELLKKLSEEEKFSFLLRLANGESLLNQKLLHRLRDFYENNTSINSDEKPRTVSELLKEVEKNKALREKEEKKIKEELMLKKLTKLEKNEKKLWQEVDTFISEKKSKSYDNAIVILKDLKELAKYKNQTRQFNIKINTLSEKYSKLLAFKTRLSEAGLK